jgi:hypothetical protein
LTNNSDLLLYENKGEIMKNKKILYAGLCMTLALVLSTFFTLQKGANTLADVKITRTVTTQIDYQALLQNFDSYDLQIAEKSVVLNANKRIALDASELDQLSAANESENTTNVLYSYDYDLENGIVYMTATLTEMDNIVAIETLQGKVFTDINGNIDVMFNIDGEIVLMSEMANLGNLDNCGWFKSLVSKVVVAVVVVVVVAAVAAVVVATAGAGMAAVVAAGAIAGAVTGGVAGGVISYLETGVVEPWAILTGVVAGAAIGALVGYGVGTIMGVGNVSVTAKFGQGSFETAQKSIEYHFSKHGASVGAKTTTEYLTKAKDFAQTIIKNNIKSVRAVEGATQGVMRYELNGYFIHMAMNAKEIIIVTFGLI